MTPLVATKGLSRNFGGLKAVDQVDFTILPGEIRALIGPNGAGKTTFVSLVSGRLLPSSGTVSFDGQDITAMPAHLRVRLGIAYTFQITSVFANLTAYDNVALPVQRTLTRRQSPPRRSHFTRGATRSSAPASPAAQNSCRHPVIRPSTAARGVAMGLALKPRLLILDEPTQGLSDGEIENFIALVRKIAGQATVLLIEHNMDCVMRLADRITVFEAGRILAEGVPDAIRANAEVQRAYLGTVGDG